MSTTTEAKHLAQSFVLAAAGWLALVAGITVLAEPTRDAIVFGAPPTTLALLAGSDTRIVSVQQSYLVVRGTTRGYVRALYANGARLVLPARGASCLDRGGKST